MPLLSPVSHSIIPAMVDENLEQLMIEAQEGKSSSYQRLLAVSAKLARAFVAKRINNAADVEDIVQEILLAIHKAKHTYHADRPYKPWLYALAHYKLNDYLRAAYRQRARTVSGDESIFATIADETVTFGDRTHEQIEEAFAELNDRQRLILTKTKLEGKTSKEVADELGMTESAVKVTVHRSIKMLKKRAERA